MGIADKNNLHFSEIEAGFTVQINGVWLILHVSSKEVFLFLKITEG